MDLHTICERNNDFILAAILSFQVYEKHYSIISLLLLDNNVSNRGYAMALLLSTDSVCLRTVVLIFCLPFIVLVHRVIVC